MTRTIPISTLLAVFLGGVLGTAARASLEPVLADGAGLGDAGVLVATLVANVLGSFVLGFVEPQSFRRGAASAAAASVRLPTWWTTWLRPGLGPGFCGAFTTFSYVMLAIAATSFDALGPWLVLLGSLTLGFAAVALGSLVGGRVQRRFRSLETESIQ